MAWKDVCDRSVKYKEHATKQYYDFIRVKKESVYNTLRPKQKAGRAYGRLLMMAVFGWLNHRWFSFSFGLSTFFNFLTTCITFVIRRSYYLKNCPPESQLAICQRVWLTKPVSLEELLCHHAQGCRDGYRTYGATWQERVSVPFCVPVSQWGR